MYNIKKSYDGAPSKNIIEEKGLTIDQATFQLDINERLWRKNGGLVIERTADTLVCEEADGSEKITWSLQEVENEA